MCAEQPNREQQRPLEPRKPEPRYYFRWELFIGIPFLLIAFLWIAEGIAPSFEFKNLMHVLDVRDEDGYVRLTCLAVVLIAVILIIKAFSRDDHSK